MRPHTPPRTCPCAHATTGLGYELAHGVEPLTVLEEGAPGASELKQSHLALSATLVETPLSVLCASTPCAGPRAWTTRPPGRPRCPASFPRQPGAWPHGDLPTTLGGAAFAPTDLSCVLSVLDKNVIHSSGKRLWGHEKQGQVYQ